MARAINQFGLTEQQERFCLAYMGEANGCASEAYRIAYPCSRHWGENTIHPAASRMLKRSKVHARLNELRRITAERTTLTLSRAKEILSNLAEQAIASPQDARTLGPVIIKAIERLAKMEQWDAPEQIQVEQVSFQLNLAPETPETPQESLKATTDDITIGCTPPTSETPSSPPSTQTHQPEVRSW